MTDDSSSDEERDKSQGSQRVNKALAPGDSSSSSGKQGISGSPRDLAGKSSSSNSFLSSASSGSKRQEEESSEDSDAVFDSSQNRKKRKSSKLAVTKR